MVLATALGLVACILSGIVLVQSKGQNLLGWAVLVLALIYVLPLMR
jgi:hypothetical protein